MNYPKATAGFQKNKIIPRHHSRMFLSGVQSDSPVVSRVEPPLKSWSMTVFGNKFNLTASYGELEPQNSPYSA